MVLPYDSEARKSWQTLLTTVAQMVDWVHLQNTRDAFNKVVAPEVKRTVDKLSSTYADDDSACNLGSELAHFLMEKCRWNGQAFEEGVDAVTLLSALKSFRVTNHRQLGKGAYAHVQLAENQLTGDVVVHKHVSLDSAEHGLPLHVLRELAILKKMRHPHIVRLHDVLYRADEVILTLEYLDCNLRELLRQTPLSPSMVKSFTHQVLQGLAYAKSKRCMHRDLKPANLLVLPHKGIIKIADFGLGRAHDFGGGRYTRQVMTLRYRAPEIMLGVQDYSAAVDMWSVGCILSEMVTGETLFRGEHEIDQLLKIFEVLGTPTAEDWPEVERGDHFHNQFPRWPRPTSHQHLAPSLDPQGLDLLKAMLEYNPRKRISADAALRHPWFFDVQLPQLL